MTEAICLATYWKAFMLGGIVGLLLPFGLLAIGACLGGAKLNARHERLMEQADYRANEWRRP